MHRYHCIVLFGLLLLLPSATSAQDWRDRMELIQYAPRYFGPHGFPIPELRSGKVGSQYEVEVRGEYHYYTGDKTKDLFLRAFLPFVKGRAAVEVSWVVYEHYKMTPETRDERNAAELTSPLSYQGDIVVHAMFQVLNSKKWFDAMISLNLKTASGGRLPDARFTDAATYWFDATVGKDIYTDEAGEISLRMQAMAGFYCWMTNDRVHRQNDAIIFGAGMTGNYRNLTLSTDFSGIYGYENDGDRPLIWRNVLNYEIRKNVISLRYHHGMKDRLYNTCALAYIRRF